MHFDKVEMGKSILVFNTSFVVTDISNNIDSRLFQLCKAFYITQYLWTNIFPISDQPLEHQVS